LLRSWRDWIGGNDDQGASFRIRLHDDFPATPATVRTYDPPAGFDVGPDPHGTLEHTPNVEFCEVAIGHSFQ
jgi:hypothetical protein